MVNISIELQGLIERLQAKERSKCCQGWLRIIQEKLAEGWEEYLYKTDNYLIWQLISPSVDKGLIEEMKKDPLCEYLIDIPEGLYIDLRIVPYSETKE